ncbi:MAG: ABC transporter substrate-binding protein, partial [Phascolarctobacterium sp.]
MEKSTKSKILPCLLVLFLLCSILISGCTRKKTAPTDEKILYSVTDATGFKLNFTAKPQRIISLSISTDEILLDLVPTASIVALTKYVDDAGISNVVERAQEVKGRVRDTNPESILAM